MIIFTEKLVLCPESNYSIVGYRRFNLILATLMVNRQLTFEPLLLRRHVQTSTFALKLPTSPIATPST